MKTHEIENEIIPEAAEALRQILSRLPDAQVSFVEHPRLSNERLPDISAHLSYKGQQLAFLVEVKRLGEPQYAHVAFRQLRDYRQADPKAFSLFTAPYISPETANLCRRENIGYFDFSGNCEITFGDVYIHIEGKPNLFVRPRSLRSLYQPKSERVLRVLLTGQIKPWRIQALADEAKVSVGQAFKVKELLLEREWLTETEHGFLLTNPEELLDDWAKHTRFGKDQPVLLHSLLSVPAFEEKLSRTCRDLRSPCAITSMAAAAHYAPYAAYQQVAAYVSWDIANLRELLDLAPVQTGANVLLLSPYDDGVFYGSQRRQNVLLASPLQTYLDLQSTGGRGREAADVLRQQEIFPHW